MRPGTEALLTLRDGGPMDAALRADLEADPAAAVELQRLRRMKTALCDLPELTPPDHVWQRVALELDADDARRIRWPLRFAAGALIAGAALLAALQIATRSAEPPAGAAPVALESTSDRPSSRPIYSPTLLAYREQSERLERMLARIPYQRPVMSASTASTIVALEERIAYVDAQLTLASAFDMQMPEREALWGERVDLINALVQVRYAQAQRTGF
jgi:hypothetical protein